MANNDLDELAALRLTVDRLAQGLQLMLEAQETQTEMLRQLLRAAAAPVAEDSSSAQAIRQLAGALAQNNQALDAIRTELEGLPGAVGREVGASLRAALDAP